jgi:hypothetical protein
MLSVVVIVCKSKNNYACATVREVPDAFFSFSFFSFHQLWMSKNDSLLFVVVNQNMIKN